MSPLLIPESVEAITILVFLTLVTVSVASLIAGEAISYLVRLGCIFFKYPLPVQSPSIKGAQEERTLQKVAGGLSVFVVALLSDDPWVMGISLFIGGLIIASEKFMRGLALIIKTNSQDIPRTAQAIAAMEFADATPREIEAKRNEEAKDLVIDTPLETPEKETASDFRSRMEQRRRDIALSETAVTDFFNRFYGDKYRSQVKLTGKDGSFVVDGALYLPDESEPSYLAEIAYFERRRQGDLLDVHVLRFRLRRILERLRYYLIDKPLIFAIVGRNLTAAQVADAVEEVRKHYGTSVWPAVFSLADDNSVEAIYPEEFAKNAKKKGI